MRFLPPSRIQQYRHTIVEDKFRVVQKGVEFGELALALADAFEGIVVRCMSPANEMIP